MKAVRIRILSGYDTKPSYTLDVSSDKFGILKYRLRGTRSYTPNSLSNLNLPKGIRLPDTIDDYKKVDDLVVDIMVALGTGIIKFKEVIFAKSK